MSFNVGSVKVMTTEDKNPDVKYKYPVNANKLLSKVKREKGFAVYIVAKLIEK